MRASKTWHCACCGETIHPGEELIVKDGEILKGGHEPVRFTSHLPENQQFEETQLELNLYL